jgi:hypothetical protein
VTPTGLVQRVDRWLLAAAPPERLAVFRILVGLYTLVYLIVRLPAHLAPTRLRQGFDPVGVLWLLDDPLPPGVVTAAVWFTPALALAFTLGAWFRVTGPALALTLLLVTTYRSSWGRLLYFDNLLVLHAMILAFTPSADALAVRWGRPAGTPPEEASSRYGWPLRLCALVTVTTYLLAGVAKLRIGGLAWADGASLRNHIAYSAARLEVLGGTPSPLARFLMGQLWLFSPMAVATLVLELGAPAALGARLRTPWVAGLWLMHAAIAGSMFVLFPYPLALVAFAPLYPLENLPARPKR